MVDLNQPWHASNEYSEFSGPQCTTEDKSLYVEVEYLGPTLHPLRAFTLNFEHFNCMHTRERCETLWAEISNLRVSHIHSAFHMQGCCRSGHVQIFNCKQECMHRDHLCHLHTELSELLLNTWTISWIYAVQEKLLRGQHLHILKRSHAFLLHIALMTCRPRRYSIIQYVICQVSCHGFWVKAQWRGHLTQEEELVNIVHSTFPCSYLKTSSWISSVVHNLHWMIGDLEIGSRDKLVPHVWRKWSWLNLHLLRNAAQGSFIPFHHDKP